MKISSRRDALGLGLTAGAAALTTSLSASAGESSQAELHFRLTPDYRPDLSTKARRQLTQAILDFLLDSHPPGMTMEIWDINPRDLPYLNKHIANVVRAVFTGVKLNLETQPVDPLLMLSLLYNESRFSPTALSPTGALGIAQFMPDTALEYGLGPVARPEAWQHYRELRDAEREQRQEQRRAFRKRFDLNKFSADAVIEKAVANGDLSILAEYQRIRDADAPDEQARQEYVTAVRADLDQYDFFHRGQKALGILDARVTYQAATAAVTYIANRLSENSGMTTSAIAAYNAGPAAVRESNPRSVLHEYGDIPAFPETVRYVQRVLVVYAEFKERLS